jgi:hypothetical protein
MAKSLPGRVIMRIEVRPGVPQKLAEVVDQFGATNISVVSRLADWFIAQDEETRLAILGNHPAPPSPEELTLQILEQMKRK